VIRLAGADDFAAIAAITNHYIRHTAIHFGQDDVTAAELRAAWQASDVHPWLVTTAPGGDVLGYAKSGVWRARAAYRWITETGIYLEPASCGRGLGEPLYRRLLAVLQAQGYHAAVGGIALPNDKSVRLHERLGFLHRGTFPRAGRKFDRWHDLGFWHLTLQAAEHVPGALRPCSEAFAATDEPPPGARGSTRRP
jgi:phosphinothricin acetyltransferase